MQNAYAATASAVLLGHLAVLWGPASAEPVEPKQLSELVAQLEKDAEAWLDHELDESEAGAKLEGLRYDEASLEALRTALRQRRDRMIQPFVLNRLLKPLLSADGELIEKVAPTLRVLYRHGRSFQRLPQYSEAALRRLKVPEYSSRARPEAVLQSMEQVQQRRLEKSNRERRVVNYNRELVRLERKLVQLLLRGGEPEDARAVLSNMARAERKGDRTFLTILQGVRDAAPQIEPAMAEALYKPLKTLGGRIWAKREKYLDPAQAKLDPRGNSAFSKQQELAGREMLQTARELATAADLPPVKVPTQEQIKRYHQKKRESRRH